MAKLFKKALRFFGGGTRKAYKKAAMKHHEINHKIIKGKLAEKGKQAGMASRMSVTPKTDLKEMEHEAVSEAKKGYRKSNSNASAFQRKYHEAMGGQRVALGGTIGVMGGAIAGGHYIDKHTEYGKKLNKKYNAERNKKGERNGELGK